MLLIGHDGQVVYRKAYGERALIPKREPMTVDTIFDAASLTKVIATTSSMMKLFEQGKIRLNDPVTKYLPEFQGGHSDITVRNLMTHFSGLRPDLDLKPAWSGYETGIQRALIDKPAGPPGVRFVYSDINFILLGEIVHRLSGKMLTDYRPRERLRAAGHERYAFHAAGRAGCPRIAPTEIDPDTGEPMRGVVHDETSRYMGGVAGHAGLFTTADDLARFAQMMLDAGVRRTASASSVRSPFAKFTTPAISRRPAHPARPRLGYRFALFQQSRRIVSDRLLRPHRLHRHFHVDRSAQPQLRHPAHQQRPPASRQIADTRCAAASRPSPPPRSASMRPASLITGYNETIVGPGLHRVVERNGQTLTGLDVLAQQNFAPLAGKRIGLITNHTGLEPRRQAQCRSHAGGRRQGRRRCFPPNTASRGKEDQRERRGFQGPRHRPSAYSACITDPRAGSRRKCWTASMRWCSIFRTSARDSTPIPAPCFQAMEEAARQHLPFYVLDRPNPITGVHVEGPDARSPISNPSSAASKCRCATA